MKTSTSSNRQRGSVLVTTMVIALLVGLLVAALLFVAQQQNYMTARSRVWCSEIPIAEAGIEEAITHIVSQPANMTDNGWTADGSNFVKRRDFTNGYAYTTITPVNITPNSGTNIILSVGFARIPLQTNFSQRSVQVLLRKKTQEWGFVAKRDIVMDGNTTYADSYISTDPRWSTDGRYDPAKRRDNCGMASVSSLKPAISTGVCKIYGWAATGPGGTVQGNVGDGTWLSTVGGLQPGHVSDDFNMVVPDVVFPPNTPTNVWLPSPVLFAKQTNNGVVYDCVLPTGDWVLTGDTSVKGNWLIDGKVRLHVDGDLQMNGYVLALGTNAALELYMGGDMDMGGTAVINPTGLTGNCLIFGLTNCYSIKYGGNTAAFARIYAPSAFVEIKGTVDFSGSVVSDRMKFSGTTALHYDEALQHGVPQFRVVSWEEL